MGPDCGSPSVAEGMAGPGTPWQLHREGSRMWFAFNAKSYPVSIEQLESFTKGALNMIHAARHWKERGE
jgi:hypothetical protein